MNDMPRPRGHNLNPDVLDDYMEQSGKTLSQVADDADMPRATLSGLYGLHHAASAPVAHQLAQATGRRVGALFPTLAPRYARCMAAAA